jgi:hypothetical protein
VFPRWSYRKCATSFNPPQNCCNKSNKGFTAHNIAIKTDNTNAQMMCRCFFFPVARAEKQVKYSIDLDNSTFKHKLPQWQVRWSFRPSYNMWNLSCLCHWNCCVNLDQFWTIWKHINHKYLIQFPLCKKWSNTEILGFSDSNTTSFNRLIQVWLYTVDRWDALSDNHYTIWNSSCLGHSNCCTSLDHFWTIWKHISHKYLIQFPLCQNGQISKF